MKECWKCQIPSLNDESTDDYSRLTLKSVIRQASSDWFSILLQKSRYEVMFSSWCSLLIQTNGLAFSMRSYKLLLQSQPGCQTGFSFFFLIARNIFQKLLAVYRMRPRTEDTFAAKRVLFMTFGHQYSHYLNTLRPTKIISFYLWLETREVHRKHSQRRIYLRSAPTTSASDRLNSASANPGCRALQLVTT